MSNSVVKVTDSMLNESLLLLVGEDGTVAPDRDTVQTYLNSTTEATDIQILHINKSLGETIEMSIDNVTYMPSTHNDGGSFTETPVAAADVDHVTNNLYSIRLDHDYTTICEPQSEEDELAKTLSILEGGTTEPPAPPQPSPVKIVVAKPPPPAPKPSTSSTQAASSKVKAKVISTQIKPTIKNDTTKKTRPKPKVVYEKDDDDDEEDSDEDYDDESEDDDNDSDYEVEEVKLKPTKLKTRQPKVTPPKVVKPKPVVKVPPKTPTKLPESEPVPKPVEPSPPQPPPITTTTTTSTTTTTTTTAAAAPTPVPPTPEVKSPEKKPPKKEKKPKPMPDDFALFSTPDIIRRVAGKDGKDLPAPTPPPPPIPQSPTPAPESDTKPAKIGLNRSKSTVDTTPTTTKQNRLSLDGKTDKIPKTDAKPEKRERKLSEKRHSTESKSSKSHYDVLEHIPSAEEIRQIISGDPSNSLTMDTDTGSDQNNMSLDAGGLDLDPSLLENINNDMISEDILYQVAQSLVSNTELQNAIDKSLNEANLGLDSSIQQVMSSVQQQQQQQQQHQQPQVSQPIVQQTSVVQESPIATKGTQIVRPDGRIVVIPPIERPTTRSRNKKKDDEPSPIKSFTHKPLDDEHVSGNELDSSGEEPDAGAKEDEREEDYDDEEEEGEEESEDDPNKLWCICNQPHNNRFMICCDTCEEWYHGKCVGITKAMGQQMENEGKEWICVYCQDSNLKRPQAAARRVRRASRNSRQSSDSAGSFKVGESGSGGSVPCVVCQKGSRSNSIYCSEACILAHAQGVERVVVFDRSSGNMLTGNKAPSAANLEQWLKAHPGYEVVRSCGKVVTAKVKEHPKHKLGLNRSFRKTPPMTQSRLKLVKNTHDHGVSLAVHKKGVNVGILKHSPKGLPPQIRTTPQKSGQPGIKIINKQVAQQANMAVPKMKIISHSKHPHSGGTPTSTKPKPTHQTTLKPGGSSLQVTKDKPMPVKTPKSRQAEQTTAQASTQPKQENIRENVKKTVFEQLTNRLKLVEDLKLTDDEVKTISTEIESQLYKCFGDTGQKYRNKYRSLIFNIKDIKNQTLWRRICEKSVNPYQLVRLSPDDLASQELALWREREAKHQLDMIKKSELELLNCNRQYVLKTHKGEQVLEDNRPTDHIDNTEVITALTESTNGDKTEPSNKRDVAKDHSDKKSSSKHSHKDRDKKSKEKDKDHHRSTSKDHDRSRKRSRSRDRKHSSGGDRKRSRSKGRDKYHKSSHKSSRHKKETHARPSRSEASTDKLDKKSKEILEQLVDSKIVPPLEDRLWKHVPQEDILPTPVAESDSDHEPTSTVTIPTPPHTIEPEEEQPFDKTKTEASPESGKADSEERSTSPPPKTKSEEIWRGVINMIDVAQISITAHEVSGDCHGLGTELPTNLDIVGRISPDTVWEYIGKMKCSNSKIISLVRLNAINVEEKMPYLALYSYLSSRNRLGVVKTMNKAVKDFYILPLASQKPIPQALLPLNGPGFEESRPALLLGIIVRGKRKRPHEPTTTTTTTTTTAPTVVTVTIKKPKQDIAPKSPPPLRSYTPPPVPKESKSKLPLPPPIDEADDDEPYSPEDSDPEGGVPAELTTEKPSAPTSFLDQASSSSSSFQPFSNKFDNIPGLGNPVLPSNTLEIQIQMEKLNKEIEMQKSEINSISQNIAVASTEIGTSALANIALPSNLQQILDSIKTIGGPTSGEASESEPSTSNVPPEKSSDLTIPLLLPTNFSRPLAPEATIPLNIPNKKKTSEGSVLSSLTEEDLIRKAAEMLGESDKDVPAKRVKYDPNLPPPPLPPPPHVPQK